MYTDALTVPELLVRRIEQDSSSPAVITADQTLTYAELDARSRTIAAWLINEAGVAKGARIGLLMENGVGWVSIAVAIMRIGAVLVPLSTFLQHQELIDQLAVASVQHLVVTPEFNGRDYLADVSAIVDPAGAKGSCRGLVRDPQAPSLRSVWSAAELMAIAPAVAAFPSQCEMIDALGKQVFPGDDMVIMFTSGSSGRAKGCIHTHGSAIRGVSTSLADRGVRRDDRLYLPMPLFWTGGFGMGLMTALITGCALITEAISEPSRTLELLSRSKVTLFRGWPDQAVRLAQHPQFAAADLGSLRPGSLDALMPSQFRAKAPSSRAALLGMTETFGPYCCFPLNEDMPTDKWGSAGRVQPGISVKIVDPETGAELPHGQSGAITVRGPNLMRGICGRETAEVFGRDGFYVTGDLGRVDEDGFLFYEGRGDDMFKAKGATVYPSEVERALRDIPGVIRAYVTDVTAQDTGEKEVGAAVVAGSADMFDASGLGAALRSRLSAFKRPTRWLIYSSIEDVPMLSSGKVDKRALRDALSRARR